MTGPSGLRAFISRSLTRDARGQSAPLGTALLLMIVLLGTTTVAAFGAIVLEDTQQQSELDRAEQSMTLFDSRAAMVALGSSSQQNLGFPNADGTYNIRDDAGWIRITHNNYTGTGGDEIIYNQSLGALVYQTGDAEIAYQGGGVWRKDSSGAVRLISPPEFHYRQATLTLPIIKTTGTGSTSGSTDVTIDSIVQGREIFPNSTDSYSDGVTEYNNPLKNGSVNITVKSPYYEGWAEYFVSRTDGKVSTNPATQTVTLQLESTADALGDFAIPEKGGSIEVPYMSSEHKVNKFNLTIAGDKNGFNQLHWSLYNQDSADVQFELHIASQQKLCTGGSGTVDLSIYYYNSSSGEYAEWQNSSIDPVVDGDPGNPNFKVNCSTQELTLDLTSDTKLTYSDIDTQGTDNKWKYQSEIVSRSVNETMKIDSHENADCIASCEATKEYPEYTSEVDGESLNFLINHYFSDMGPTFRLTVHEGPGNGNSGRVDAGNSYGSLDYDVTDNPKFITFLHITENEIAVRLD
ncbi:DUF7289 family protein [Haladaptatus sp. CMSO5]|uniref:DUF7289 family protein n=1 Tax=Haladaptatus sp. CMSO5 TaxID=3120514 RepID=UPI002FCE5F08